jgi:serine phosphatase RsbU (regulator of sigma subunit)
MSLRLGARIVVGLLVALSVVVGVLVYVQVDAARQAQSEVQTVTEPATTVVQRLLSDYVNQETGERGYLITGQDSFLTPYTQGQTAADRDVTRLRQLLADHPPVLSTISAVTGSAAAWRTVVIPEIDARRAGDPARAAALEANGAAKGAFDAVRARVDALSQQIGALRTAAQTRQNHSVTLLLWALILAAGFALAAVLMLAWFSRHWVVLPLVRLGGQLHKVREGDLDAPIAATGPAEIVQLGADADSMRRALVTEIDAARHADEALSQGAPVVVELRRQLAPSTIVPVPGLDLAGVVVNAEGELSGDWWDSWVGTDGSTVVVLADVTGHGATAALIGAQLKAILTTGLRGGLPSAQVLRSAAHQLFGDRDHLFATAVILEFDPSAGRVRWTNAGHPGPLLVTEQGVEVLAPTGSLVNPIASDWQTRETSIAPGDLVVAFSDGLVESSAAGGDQFDETGVSAVLSPLRGRRLGPEAIVAALLDARTAHAGSRQPRDDVTIVCVLVTGD